MQQVRRAASAGRPWRFRPTIKSKNRPETRHPLHGGGYVDTAELDALIQRADRADPIATDKLFALLYRELHRLAEQNLHRGGSAVTLSPTTLLHETYLHLSGR